MFNIDLNSAGRQEAYKPLQIWMFQPKRMFCRTTEGLQNVETFGNLQNTWCGPCFKCKSRKPAHSEKSEMKFWNDWFGTCLKIILNEPWITVKLRQHSSFETYRPNFVIGKYFAYRNVAMTWLRDCVVRRKWKM